jgi:hypothetical protein
MYQKKHNKLPFIQYGKNSLWLKGKSFIDDIPLHKIQDKQIVMRDKIEVDKILNERKSNVSSKIITIKNVEFSEETIDKTR